MTRHVTMSRAQRSLAAVASPGAIRAAGALLRTGARSPWLVAPLLVLVATGACLVGRVSAPTSLDQQLPPHVGVPAHASLTQRDDFLQDHVQVWYYVVQGSSQEALTTYYLGQLSQDSWHCFRAMTLTNMVREGKTYSGSSVYMTAVRGNTKALISTGDQEYGSFLLQDELPVHAIALKITLETMDNPSCG